MFERKPMLIGFLHSDMPDGKQPAIFKRVTFEQLFRPHPDPAKKPFNDH